MAQHFAMPESTSINNALHKVLYWIINCLQFYQQDVDFHTDKVLLFMKKMLLEMVKMLIRLLKNVCFFNCIFSFNIGCDFIYNWFDSHC